LTEVLNHQDDVVIPPSNHKTFLNECYMHPYIELSLMNLITNGQVPKQTAKS